MYRVFKGFEYCGHFVDDLESCIAGHRITAAEQQAGVEFDLDPQLIAAHRQLFGRDQITKGMGDVIGNGLERVIGALPQTGVSIFAVFYQGFGRLGGQRALFSDGHRLDAALGVIEHTDQRLGNHSVLALID